MGTGIDRKESTKGKNLPRTGQEPGVKDRRKGKFRPDSLLTVMVYLLTFVDTASSLLNKFGQMSRSRSLMASVEAVSSR